MEARRMGERWQVGIRAIDVERKIMREREIYRYVE